MLRSPVSGSWEITHDPVTYGAGSWSRVHRQSGSAVASNRSPVWITSLTGPVRVPVDPVPRDVDPAADPHVLVALDVVEVARERRGAPGPAHEPHVQAERHHLRSVGALRIEDVEGVPNVGKPLVAGGEAAGQPELHVVVVEGVGNVRMRRQNPTRLPYSYIDST